MKTATDAATALLSDFREVAIGYRSQLTPYMLGLVSELLLEAGAELDAGSDAEIVRYLREMYGPAHWVLLHIQIQDPEVRE